MKTLRHPATIISIVALFFSLTGGAIAAVVITGKNVRNNSLTGADVRNGSIASADVK
ncbi:MAG: hypothetical protein F2817_11920, partial [Actinobacteria bacterium]|nr:hypothetical protein [Actinomycetota bacterium]